MNKASSVNVDLPALILAFNKSIKAYNHSKGKKGHLARKKFLNVLRKVV